MRRMIVLIGAAAMLFSCATVDDSTKAAQGPPPDWVLGSLPSEAGYEFFIGSASDSTGDIAAAEAQATNSLVGEITRFLGVRVTSETSAEAKATLDSFEASVKQTVSQTAEARVTGFRVVDRFVDQREGRVTVYLLGRYDSDELMAEKERISAAFQEREEAISGPEAEGVSLEAEGDFYQAARRYITAASAALDSEVENADVKFERNIANARDVIQLITLEKLSDNLSTFVNQSFDDSFALQIITSDGEPVPDAQVLVSHKILRSNGRLGIRQVTLVADDEGIVRFEHPIPEFVGEESVTMSLDLSADLEALQDAGRDQRSLVSSLEDVALRKRVTFQYSVLSNARNVATGVVFLDTDIAGNPISPSDATASGLLQQLTEAGFNVRSIPLDPTELADRTDAEIAEMLASTYAGQVDRIIYGVAAIDSFEETEGFLVKVTGNARALDLSTGEILYAASAFRNSRGNTSSGAIAGAFRNLGVRFGEEMVRSLP